MFYRLGKLLQNGIIIQKRLYNINMKNTNISNTYNIHAKL